MSFREIKPAEWQENVFEMLDKDWCLLTADGDDRPNTMTVSWGGVGIMWHKPVAFVVVRPERYTHELIEKGSAFSLTVFDTEYKKMLGYCGSVSGRNEDKIAKCGLTVQRQNGTPYFAEARLALICRKLTRTPLQKENFLGNDALTDQWYGAKGGYHDLYIAEIESILVKE